MKIANNSDEHRSYTPEDHIENLKILAEFTKGQMNLELVLVASTK